MLASSPGVSARRILAGVDELKEQAATLRATHLPRSAPRSRRIGLQCAGLAELNPLIAAVLTQRLGRTPKLAEIAFADLFAAADTRHFDAVFGTADAYPDREDVRFTALYQDTPVAVTRRGSPLSDATEVRLDDVADLSTLDTSALPPRWAAPFGMTALISTADRRLAPCRPPTDSRDAARLAVSDNVTYVSALSDRVMADMPSVSRTHIVDAPPIVFGVYTFGHQPDTHEAADDNAVIVDVAQQAVASFLDIVPGARALHQA